MASAVLLLLIVGVSIEFVVGIALNLHILIVYMGNLKNGVSLGSSDKVHLTKALLNVSVHVMMTGHSVIYVFWPHSYFVTGDLLWVIFIIHFLKFYSYWLTALLCVFYCTNITTCAHHIFVWLKRSLSSYLIHIILLSGLGSVMICFPGLWFGNRNSVLNGTESMVTPRRIFNNDPYSTTSSILGCFLPLAIALVSTTFTSWSLISHMWRMKRNHQGFTSCNLHTQIDATRTMILFLLIFGAYSVTQIFFSAIRSSVSNDIFIIFWLFTTSYPILEAAIIIQSSSKFRNGLLTKFCGRNRRGGETQI